MRRGHGLGNRWPGVEPVANSRAVGDRAPTGHCHRAHPVGGLGRGSGGGPMSKSAVATLVDGRSRFLRLVHLPDGHRADQPVAALRAALASTPAGKLPPSKDRHRARPSTRRPRLLATPRASGLSARVTAQWSARCVRLVSAVRTPRLGLGRGVLPATRQPVFRGRDSDRTPSNINVAIRVILAGPKMDAQHPHKWRCASASCAWRVARAWVEPPPGVLLRAGSTWPARDPLPLELWAPDGNSYLGFVLAIGALTVAVLTTADVRRRAQAANRASGPRLLPTVNHYRRRRTKVARAGQSDSLRSTQSSGGTGCLLRGLGKSAPWRCCHVNPGNRPPACFHAPDGGDWLDAPITRVPRRIRGVLDIDPQRGCPYDHRGCR